MALAQPRLRAGRARSPWLGEQDGCVFGMAGRSMNVLIDTNVLLSAALRDKLPERVVLYVAGRDDFRWLVTPEILAEYTEVLRRPRFGLDEEILGHWAELLAMRTAMVASPPTVP